MQVLNCLGNAGTDGDDDEEEEFTNNCSDTESDSSDSCAQSVLSASFTTPSPSVPEEDFAVTVFRGVGLVRLGSGLSVKNHPESFC